MKFVKLVKQFVKNVKDAIMKEVNDWKEGLSTLRNRLEDAEVVIKPSNCEPRELKEVEKEEYIKLYSNGLNVIQNESTRITKFFSTISFVDSKGIDRTWIVNGHITISDVIYLMLCKTEGIYQHYLAASFTTPCNEDIKLIITHNVLPEVVTAEDEVIQEVAIRPIDENAFWKLFKSNAIFTSEYITMDVKGTKYIVDEFYKRFSTVA
jgi:hypothetical protein